MFGVAHAKDAKDGKDALRRENSMGMIHSSWGMVGRYEILNGEIVTTYDNSWHFRLK